MATKTQWTLGTLLFTLLATGVFTIQFGDDLKIRVDDDKTTFKILEESRWRVAGREYNSLWDGASKMNRDVSEIKVWHESRQKNITVIYRETPLIRGPVIRDKYVFDGKITDIELVPLQHEVCIENGEGFIYQYEVRDLVYNGNTIKNVPSPQSFGRNMKVEWEDGWYWSKVYKSGILKVRYRPQTNYECYDVRLFDPITNGTLLLEGQFANLTAELGSQINATANITAGSTVCIDVDHPAFGTNVSCGTSTTTSLFSIEWFRRTTFNDSSTSQNFTIESGTENNTVYFRGHGYDEIVNFTVNLTGSGSKSDAFYTGFNFSADAPSNPIPQGVEFNGTHYWVANQGDGFVVTSYSRISEYDSAGAETGTFLNFTQDGTAIGIDWNGSNFFLIGQDTDRVWQYNSSLEYTGFNFSVSGQTSFPAGVAWNGSHFFVVAYSPDAVFIYNSSGDYTGTSFSVADSFPNGIDYYNGFLYVTGNDDIVIEYSLDGTATGFNFSVEAEESLSRGISFNGTVFHVTGIQNDAVFEYELNFTKPKNVRIYVNNTFDKSAGDLTGDVNLTQFSDGNTVKNSTLTADQLTQIGLLKIPKVATILSSSVNVTGITGEELGYLIGGDTTGANINTTRKYTVSLDNWTNVTAFPATLGEGIGLTIGDFGYAGIGSGPGTAWYQYNARTDAWTQKTSFFVNGDNPTAGSTGVSCNGKAYVGLGVQGGAPDYQNNWSFYDPDVNNWTVISDPMATQGRSRAMAFCLNNKVYAGGGAHSDVQTNRMNDFYVYDLFQRNEGNFFDGSTEDTDMQGIDFNGSNYYLVGTQNDLIYEYDISGSYTGFNISVGSEEANPQGVSWHNGKWYIVGHSSNTVYEYNSTGPTGFNFSVSAQTTFPLDLDYNGSHFFVVTTGTLYIYNSTGGFLSSFSTSPSTNTRAVEFINGFLYIGDIGGSPDTLYEFTVDGTATGENFSTDTPLGIATNTSHWIVLGNSDAVRDSEKGVDVWLDAADLPQNKSEMGYFTLGGFGYIVSGLTGTTNPGTHDTQVHRYDPSANSWSSMTDVSRNISRPASFVTGSIAYVCGGRDQTESSNPVHIDCVTNSFSPDSWGTTASWGSQAIRGHSAFVATADAITDPRVEVGNADDSAEFNFSGVYTITNTTSSLNTALQAFLSTCSADGEGFCFPPIAVESSSAGTIRIDDISVEYSPSTNPVSINSSLVQTFLDNSGNGFHAIPITIQADVGIVNVSAIQLDYKGGNATYEIRAHNPAYTENESLFVTYYHSRWNWSLPRNTNFIEFIPRTPTSKNVTPFRQTNAVPMINFTGLNYGGKDFNFSEYLNESFSCVNLSVNNNSNISTEIILQNGTWTYFYSNVSLEESFGAWYWADYGCNFTSWRLWQPQFIFRACCEGCNVCSEETS